MTFVHRSRRREGHDLPSSTAPDPGTGISLAPGSWRRSLWHRSSEPASNSNSVAQSDPILWHERLESDARLLRLVQAIAADVEHGLRRERALSSAVEVHEDRLCPDAWHPEYEGDEHTCVYAYDGEGPICLCCEAVWKDKLHYGQVCPCCVMSDRQSCPCHLSSIFKFPGTKYILGTASPTPTAVASPTAVAEAASAPPLSSASIAPSPLSLNLLSYTPPHSTQAKD